MKPLNESLKKPRINLETPERVALVRSLFSRIVPRYDLLNRLLSLHRDVFWRRATARRANPRPGSRILDVACGTGDLALALAELHPTTMVVGLDFVQPMLTRAKEKIWERHFEGLVFLVNADAMNLPFKNESFDAVTIAFGIRNIPDKIGALREMQRVLIPGGRALVLELTFPRWSFLRRIYRTYLNRLIPHLGRLISGHHLAYQYLADSIMDFPAPQAFCRLMSAAGFTSTGYIPYTFGTCVLHWGIKP